LVTGGARGIGRGIATELLHAGALVIVGDLVEHEMEETCRELASIGKVDWVKLDVSDQESMHAGAAAIRTKHGPIEILVNNAGIASGGVFAEEDPRRITKELAIDLAGPLCLARIVLPR
jgi:2-hydroxycyclohexanecarboxyl-CoA dehydrogenase